MSIARSASSLQLARETRERFVSATEGAIAPLARAIRDRLTTLSTEAGTARSMQDNRDDFVAFQGQATQWVTLSQAGWRKALAASSGGTGTLPSALRLELVCGQLVGLAMMRYVLQVEPVASTSAEEIVRQFAPAIRATLKGA